MAKTLVYQLYPLAWPDGLKGMTKHLSRVAELGADYVWLSPIYDSPLEDGGYDVADYKSINKRFKKGCSFREFVDRAHSIGLGVVMDLPINHTSTRHRWFDAHPEYYCWSKVNHPGWRNLFNDDSAWQYLESDDLYYLHLFHHTQADLNWFPAGKLNFHLVYEFQDIVDFWIRQGVDGFRIDFPQGINKDFEKMTLDLDDLLYGHKAVEVINAIFDGREDLFLMMECFDPTMGDIVNYYTENTSVNFVSNVLTKEEIARGELEFLGLIERQAKNPRYMLELESHDSPRFPSRGATPEDMIWSMFNSAAEGICLYQGQELGLENPTKSNLPDKKLLALDAQTSMRYIKGENIDALRPLSRANARIPIPLDEYSRQEQDPSSYLHLTKRWIQRWREDKIPRIYPSGTAHLVSD